MTDDEKREHAEAIKHALGMGYGPPMEGEEGWVPPSKKITAWVMGARDLPGSGSLLTLQVPGPEARFRPGMRVKITAPEDMASSPIRALVLSIMRPSLEGPWGLIPPLEVVVSWSGPPSFIFQPQSVTVEMDESPPTDDYDWCYPAIDDDDNDAAVREAEERLKAQQAAEQKAAAQQKAPPSSDPWAVVGKAEDDGDRIMDITRNFG